MPELKARDLRVGGRYVHASGQSIRVIDAIEGGNVHYHDETAPLHCLKKDFLATVVAETPAKQKFSGELINSLLGGEVDAVSFVKWHEALKTNCALVQHNVTWLWSALRNRKEQIMGTIGYDQWNWLDGYLDAAHESAKKLQATLSTFEAD
jgi:hypothetical protein